MNIAKRKEEILKGRELSLAVEGRTTNLRIWIGEGVIYMRLDKANSYSTPFNAHGYSYLLKEHKLLKELLKFYNFGKTNIDQLDRVLDITKDMKYRELIEW